MKVTKRAQSIAASEDMFLKLCHTVKECLGVETLIVTMKKVILIYAACALSLDTMIC